MLVDPGLGDAGLVLDDLLGRLAGQEGTAGAGCTEGDQQEAGPDDRRVAAGETEAQEQQGEDDGEDRQVIQGKMQVRAVHGLLHGVATRREHRACGKTSARR